MAARDLLLVLFVVGCAGCEMDPFEPLDWDEISEEEQTCELEPVSDSTAAPSRALKLTADSRISCGGDWVLHTSVAVGPDALYLIAGVSDWSSSHYDFYRLDH